MRASSFAHLSRPAALLMLLMCVTTFTYAQITPSADAFTNSGAPATNYGANVLLYVDGATEISYIQFNLSSIPAGASVSQATLKLYVNAVTTAGSFNVDYVNGAWTESTITHNLAPALGTTIVSGVAITTTSKNQYILINITPAVQAWLSGSQANDGIALVANSTFNASFDSKENTTTSHPAELDIVFAEGAGTITGVTTASGSGLQGGGTSGTLNLSLTNACAANQVLQWNGTAWVCANSGGGGTVTAVGLSASSSDFIVTGSPVTTTGTLGLGWIVAPDWNDTPLAIVKRDSTGSFSASTINASIFNATTSFNLGGNVFAQGFYAITDAFVGFAGNATLSGTANTGLGYQSLMSETTGYSNTAVGSQALLSDTTGWGNSAIGTTALTSNITGNGNIAMGGLTLYSNVSGSWNTATGGRALYYATSGYNTANGHDALYSTSTGSNNTAVGAEALLYNTTGSNNTALGSYAAYDQTYTGLTNATAIGANSDVTESNALVLGCVGGVNNCPASVNVGIGTTAPQYALDVHGTGNFTGLVTFAPGQTFPGGGTITGVTAGTGLTGGGTSGNVILNVDTTKVVTGVAAGTALTGGGTGGALTLNVDTTQVPLLNSPSNTFAGNLSAAGVITGSAYQIGSNLFAFGSYVNSNVFVGFSGNMSTTGTKNTATGYLALAANTIGLANTANGNMALAVNTSGIANTALGSTALASNISGNSNTAVGSRALNANTTGTDNNAVGVSALYLNTVGTDNDALGGGALYSNISGVANVAVGSKALYSNTGGYWNTAVGYMALYSTTGSPNTAIGYSALMDNTTGSSNNAFGENALWQNTTGSDNTAVGDGALATNNGNNNVAIGYGSGGGNYTGNNLTCLGALCSFGADGLTNATAIGIFASVAQSNSLVLGGTGYYAVKVGIGTTTPTNVFTIGQGAGQAIADGWATYSSRRWKTNIHTLHDALGKIEQLRGVSYNLKDSGKPEIGVIAEEVGAVVPEVVSWEKNGKDAQSVDYGRLTALLIEATKEQQALIREQQEQIRAQQAQMKVQQAQIGRLTRQVKTIQATIKAGGQSGTTIHTVKAEATTIHQ